MLRDFINDKKQIDLQLIFFRLPVENSYFVVVRCCSLLWKWTALCVMYTEFCHNLFYSSSRILKAGE